MRPLPPTEMRAVSTAASQLLAHATTAYHGARAHVCSKPWLDRDRDSEPPPVATLAARDSPAARHRNGRAERKSTCAFGRPEMPGWGQPFETPGQDMFMMVALDAAAGRASWMTMSRAHS